MYYLYNMLVYPAPVADVQHLSGFCPYTIHTLETVLYSLVMHGWYVQFEWFVQMKQRSAPGIVNNQKGRQRADEAVLEIKN